MKCILTVIGKDKPGIIAKVSNLLANVNVNIEDISQTIMQNTFTMIMLVNLDGSDIQLFELKQKCKDLYDSLKDAVKVFSEIEIQEYEDYKLRNRQK